MSELGKSFWMASKISMRALSPFCRESEPVIHHVI